MVVVDGPRIRWTNYCITISVILKIVVSPKILSSQQIFSLRILTLFLNCVSEMCIESYTLVTTVFNIGPFALS